MRNALSCLCRRGRSCVASIQASFCLTGTTYFQLGPHPHKSMEHRGIKQCYLRREVTSQIVGVSRAFLATPTEETTW